jgi:hypothetical protein
MARLGWIPWRACEARKVLRLDLKPGGYLFDKDVVKKGVFIVSAVCSVYAINLKLYDAGPPGN